MTVLRGAAVAALLGLAGAGAWAHDTWFSPSPQAAAGGAALELSTGNRYPVQEFNPAASSLVRSGCSDGSGQAVTLRAAGDRPRSLALAARAKGPRQPVLACWAELKPFDLEMDAAKVEVYFQEIRANAAHRQAWAAIRERGQPWRESYRKFARIELPAAGAATAPLVAARRPVGMDLELVVLGGQPIVVGPAVEFQLLRDGQPLADFPLELVSERSALGVWRQTDADGRVRHVLPFGGRWLLRGTDLRLSPQDPDRWVSRFVTLAFEAP